MKIIGEDRDNHDKGSKQDNRRIDDDTTTHRFTERLGAIRMKTV